MSASVVDLAAWLPLLAVVAATMPLVCGWRFRSRTSEHALARTLLLVIGFTAAVVVLGKVTL
jgi:hypothetical protein